MLYGLQAGFGSLLGSPTLEELKRLRFDGIRLDCQDLTPSNRLNLITEATDHGLIPLVIVRNADQMEGIPVGTNVEIRSEPDIHTHRSFGLDDSDRPVTPQEYLNMIFDAYEEAKKRNLILWAGTVSNFNERGLNYLEQMIPQAWPADLPISIHWYPHGRTPNFHHEGFSSREDEVGQFKSIIGNRPWGISEFGYHTGINQTCFTLFGYRFCYNRWRWTDEEVYQHAVREWRFWRLHGASFAVWYQINDGTNPDDRESAFGIRRRSGEWKPVSQSVIDARSEL